MHERASATLLLSRRNSTILSLVIFKLCIESLPKMQVNEAMHMHDAMATNTTAPIDYETVGPAYTSPDITSCPPLVQLKAYGICCPLFETEEDQDARVGVQLLNNYPITWYRKQQQETVDASEGDGDGDEKPSDEAGGFIDGLVSSLLGNDTKSKSKSKSSVKYYGVPATLSIIDTDQCGPLIKVKAASVDKDEDKDKDKEWWDDETKKPPSISIPLHLVDTVSAGWSLIGDSTQGGIKLFARKEQSKGLFGSGTGEELLRFDTHGGGGDDWSETVIPVKSTEANEHADRIIARLRALIEWNRRRMAADVQQGKVVSPSSFIEIS